MSEFDLVTAKPLMTTREHVLLEEINRLKTALEQAKKRMKNCRKAIASNQVVDKDVSGSLARGIAEIDYSLGN